MGWHTTNPGRILHHFPHPSQKYMWLCLIRWNLLINDISKLPMCRRVLIISVHVYLVFQCNISDEHKLWRQVWLKTCKQRFKWWQSFNWLDFKFFSICNLSTIESVNLYITKQYKIICLVSTYLSAWGVQPQARLWPLSIHWSAYAIRISRPKKSDKKKK